MLKTIANVIFVICTAAFFIWLIYADRKDGL